MTALTLLATFSALSFGIWIGITWQQIKTVDYSETEKSVKILGRKFWVVEDNR